MQTSWYALILTGIIAASADTAAASQPSSSPSPVLRIRPMHPYVERLLAVGQQRSASFAGLLRALERSDVIIYVDLDTRMSDDASRAGSLFFVTTSGGQRWLRIQLYTHTTSWSQTLKRERHFIATLAHELQHAVEVATDRSVRDQESFTELFRTTGFRNGMTRQHHAYETLAAQEMGQQVFLELRGRGLPTRPGPDDAGRVDLRTTP